MAGYFEEMGWRELEDGQRPDFLELARFLRDYGIYGPREWPRLPPPASREAVENLEEITIEQESDDCKCPICLNKFKVGDKPKKMPCHHMFHDTCILTWLNKTNSCPFCRYELPTDNEDYEAFKKEKDRAEQREENIRELHNSMFS